MEKDFTAYNILARYYDEFQDVENFQEILQIILDQIAQNFKDILPEKYLRITDLGCGTGNLSLALLQHDFLISAIDLSEQMIEIVRQKSSLFSSEIRQRLHLFHTDFLTHTFLEEQDVLLALTDTLNHLTLEQLSETFIFAAHNLNRKGLFIFDLLKYDYLIEERGNQTFFVELGDDPLYPDLSMIWENEWLETEKIAISNLTFFEIIQETRRYKRSIDQIVEYYHDLDTVESHWQNEFTCLKTIDYPERRLYILQR